MYSRVLVALFVYACACVCVCSWVGVEQRNERFNKTTSNAYTHTATGVFKNKPEKLVELVGRERIVYPTPLQKQNT